MKSLARRSQNFTSADTKGLIQNCSLDKMSAALKEENEDPDLSITESDIEATLTTFVKGMTALEIARYKAIYEDY